jgi:peptidyl-tRNA hydrolase, PTH1 family
MGSEHAPWLLVGLGNPGEEYARNRHNIGFMAVERFSEEARLGAFSKKHKGEMAQGEVFGERVFVLKPLTFMNLSGDSVARAAAFFSVPIEHVVVVHDEVDLDFGKLRVKAGGGHGGHNGLRSIHAQLKSPDYLRIRLGIGRSSPKGDVTNHVLGDFSKAEREALSSEILPKAVQALEMILRRGVSAAMNEFNAEPKPRKDDLGEKKSPPPSPVGGESGGESSGNKPRSGR